MFWLQYAAPQRLYALAGHVQAGGLALVTSHQPLGVPCLDLRLGP